MDRRFGASALVICLLAILVSFAKPEFLPKQLSCDKSLLLGESLDCDPLITQSSSSQATTNPYEFYKISMQWPKSECNRAYGCVIAPPPYFTIHGLWPQYKPDTQVPPYNPADPIPCTGLNPALATSITTYANSRAAGNLYPILIDMNHHWPSLRSHNLNFWRLEWNYHGKCWDDSDKPIRYFQRTLNFAMQYNLTLILEKEGIVPLNGNPYDRSKISNAIHNALGKIPEINCNRLNQLREIRVCYDIGHNLIDCPTPFTVCNYQYLEYPEP